MGEGTCLPVSALPSLRPERKVLRLAVGYPSIEGSSLLAEESARDRHSDIFLLTDQRDICRKKEYKNKHKVYKYFVGAVWK